MWTGEEVSIYEQLRQRTLELQKDVPEYVKEIIALHLADRTVE